jgi:hypothetical protein
MNDSLTGITNLAKWTAIVGASLFVARWACLDGPDLICTPSLHNQFWELEYLNDLIFAGILAKVAS